MMRKIDKRKVLFLIVLLLGVLSCVSVFASWQQNGNLICSFKGYQEHPQITSDGAGGAIIAWQDWRNDNFDIYAGRVDASGNVMWAADGVAICAAEAHQSMAEVTSDGAGGAIISWSDTRVYNTQQVYAQRVSADGPGGPTAVCFASASATAEGGYVTLSWQMAVHVPAPSFVVERSESTIQGFVVLDLAISQGAGLSFSCTDYSVVGGKTYWYRIEFVGASGVESYGPIEVQVPEIPSVHRAYQNYPNPFNPACTIRYDIPTAANVSLQVFDLSGALVRTLVDGLREPGMYSEIWDGRAEDGRELPSGVYFYRLEAGDFRATSKMALLK